VAAKIALPICEMAFGQITRNKIGDIRISPLQFGALLQCVRHRLSREIFLGAKCP
jgi:hypothetical protein